MKKAKKSRAAKSPHKIIKPQGWKRPRGYSNGIEAEGRIIFIAGQIGWDENEKIVSNDITKQIHQALKNVVAVVREAGGKPHHITKMTWYVTNKEEYRAALHKIGEVYRKVIGEYYPAMALIPVPELLEDEAKVEIEAVAVIGDGPKQ